MLWQRRRTNSAQRFNWNTAKAQSYARKLVVTFQEATTVFADALSATIDDPLHSESSDERYMTIGRSIRNRTLVVIHSDQDETVRIIYARLTTRHERTQYEEGF